MRHTFWIAVFALAIAALPLEHRATAADAHAPAPAAQSPPLDDDAVAEVRKALKVSDGETLVFFGDLHCATCAKKVTSALFKQKGVMRVRTSVKLDAAVVTPQAKKPLDAAAAWVALQKAGYQPARLEGPQGVFLPDGDELAPLKVAEAPAAAVK